MTVQSPSMRIIGLTGRIGAGKSTVARWLAEWGAVTLDSDALVRELYASDQDVLAQLRARFGPEVVGERGVDRAALARQVFGAPAALVTLEAIVHPAVLRLRAVRLEAARRAGAPAAVVEAIKLVESGASATCDELWIVVADEPVQLRRLVARGVEESEARRRLAAQGSVDTWVTAFVAESFRQGHSRPIYILDNSQDEAQGRKLAAKFYSPSGGQSGEVPPPL